MIIDYHNRKLLSLNQYWQRKGIDLHIVYWEIFNFAAFADLLAPSKF